MKPGASCDIPRRRFLKLAATAGLGAISPAAFAAADQRICILIDPAIPAASQDPILRAAARLQNALAAKSLNCQITHSTAGLANTALSVVVAASESQIAGAPSSTPTLHLPESLRIAPGRIHNTPALFVQAPDPRGFVYALLELAERVHYGDHPLRDLQLSHPLDEQPANQLRCVGRYFCSELEDKPWYYDKTFWTGYLDHLTASRFNRFTLAYGLEYDFPRGVTDDYFHFPYPYLVDVPGYPDVRVRQLASPEGARLTKPQPLSSQEREKNLEILRFVAAQTAARGLQFQLGIWTHAYQWTDSPDAYHRIEGLTPQNHARYCRDALAIILRECPQIQGITMRVHGESGIPEGSYSFWQTVFEAISHAGRTIEIDMHAKGVDQKIIDIALATGMPVKLGAKYSAEHQSLGYQQADIRALEIPHGRLSKTDSELFSLSSGSRSFTRYGYADFLRADAPYKLWFRLWPGTQRHLLSVDPEMAAAYGRSASFCGAVGLDLMEPLTFKGREGSGQPGGRCAYADPSLNPDRDWQKFDLYYRVWGRKLYNPAAGPESWHRRMRADFGPAADATANSLAHASRILPLLTSAHLPSASNHDLWYELPTNMPIVEGSEPSPYGDTPTPKIFSTVSPLDPQLFSSVIEYAQALTQHNLSAKYSPIQVAQWVENLVDNARSELGSARRAVKAPTGGAFRRIEEDVLIQIGLGSFFAHKLRSAVLYEIFLRSGDTTAGHQAIEHYQKGRDAWEAMAQRARGVYRANVSYGHIPKRSGHWSDRLPAIDTDLAAMKAKIQSALAETASRRSAAEELNIIAGILQPANQVTCAHTPPKSFNPASPLTLTLSASGGEGIQTVHSVRLFYRHVNQAERWIATDATAGNGHYSAAIPVDYTHSEFSLEYYFELRNGLGKAWMYPGFNPALSNQPYFTIQRQTP